MTQDDVLVDAAKVVAWLADGEAVVLLDCRFDLGDTQAGRGAHDAMHPRDALHADLERDLSGPKTGIPGRPDFRGRHPLPPRDAFAATVAAWGIKPHTRVVTFDAQGAIFAARAWWLLRWLGHARVWVLDGGLAAWSAAGGAMTDAASKAVPATPYPALPAGMPTVDANRLAHERPRWRIVDARSADRFRGDNESIDPVAGHIPGAVNRFYKDNLDIDGRFKSPSALSETWAPVLVGADATRVAQQCGSGVTACQNILASMHAGLAATALYPGSWSEWSADPARPVAVGD